MKSNTGNRACRDKSYWAWFFSHSPLHCPPPPFLRCDVFPFYRGASFTGLTISEGELVHPPCRDAQWFGQRAALFLVSNNSITGPNNVLRLSTFAESVYPTSAVRVQLSLPSHSNQCKLGQISAVNYKLDPKLEGHHACYSTSFPPPLDGKLHQRSFLNKSDFIVKLGHWRDITSLALILK